MDSNSAYKESVNIFLDDRTTIMLLFQTLFDILSFLLLCFVYGTPQKYFFIHVGLHDTDTLTVQRTSLIPNDSFF